MKVFRLLFVGALSSFAVAAYGVTPQQQAFAQAQALANGAQAGAVASVGGGSVAATVSKFNPTYYNASGNAPESALFQGGNGQPAGNGVTKANNCKTGAPNPDKFLQQNCDAINFMVKNPTARPQISLPPSMFAPSKAIVANAPALAGGSLGIAAPNAAGGFTGCTNQTTTPPPTLEICRDFTGTAAQQCLVGRVVIVDSFTQYQCDKTTDVYTPQSCDKTVNVSVVQPPPVAATVVLSCPATHSLIGNLCYLISTAPAPSFNSIGLICPVGWLRTNNNWTCTLKNAGPGTVPAIIRARSSPCPVGWRTYANYVISTYSSLLTCSHAGAPPISSYSCPSGLTMLSDGISCAASPVITKTTINGCTVQETAAL